MRLYLTFILFICAATQFANAQTLATDLKFDQRLVNCEKKWVVFPAKQGDPHYAYGFVYLDQMAGFTFDLKGVFTVDNTDHYLVDTSATKNGMVKYRLTAGMPTVALVPAKRFAEMHLPQMPYWIASYYTPYTDTIAHNFRLGFNLNAIDECAAALTYLQPIYIKKPDYPGLAFELAFAYNVLKQGDNAIKVLEPAIKNTPKDIMLYRELGFAYALKSDLKNTVEACKRGIEMCNAQQVALKAELTFNIAITYKNAGFPEDYKTWALKAKELSPPNSNLYKTIVSQGF